MDRPLHPHSGSSREPDPPASDPRLEALLRRSPLPPARGAFRDALRARFLEGDLEQRVKTASRAPDPDRTSRHTVADLERSLAALPLAPPARGEFRDELRRVFVSGAVAGPDLDGLEEARPAGRLVRLLVPLAAAAAIVLITVLQFTGTGGLLRSREWQASLVGRGPVKVLGVDLGQYDEDQIGVELTRGGRLESNADIVELLLDGELVVQVQPETSLMIGRLPDPGSGEKLVIEIESGEAYLKTLEHGIDYPIHFVTKQAYVQVTGTVLGVLVDENGTCVCVAEGVVEVVDRTLSDEPTITVERQFSHRIFPAASMQAKHVPFGMEPKHTDPLTEFAATTF